jgi:hypothetical protein
MQSLFFRHCPVQHDRNSTGSDAQVNPVAVVSCRLKRGRAVFSAAFSNLPIAAKFITPVA